MPSKKKKVKVIEFTVNIDLFDIGVDFVICPDRHYIVSQINKERGIYIDIDESCEGQCIRTDQYNPLILIDRIPKTPREKGTLQHEIFHATVGVLVYNDIPLESASEEIWSNTIGYITEKFYECVKQYRKNIKNKRSKKK